MEESAEYLREALDRDAALECLGDGPDSREDEVSAWNGAFRLIGQGHDCGLLLADEAHRNQTDHLWQLAPGLQCRWVNREVNSWAQT